MNYKILIFDLDDTLIDNKENTRAAFSKMISANGQKYSDDKFNKWYELDRKFWVDWQDGLIEVPDDIKHETGKKSDKFLDWVRSQRVILYFEYSVSSDVAIQLNNIYTDALNDVVIAVEGARDTLSCLSDKYQIIVATNGPQVATQQKLKKIDCLQFTNEVLSADMFGYMKPKIEFFEAIEKRYKDFSNEDYLVVGDSLKSDVGFGMNSRIDSCWFKRGKNELVNGYSPTYVINQLLELRDIL